MAATPNVNIVIPQGCDFSEVFNSTETDGSPSNLAGYTGNSQLKKHSGAQIAHNFTVNITGATGEVSIAMTAGRTASIVPGRYYYDVRLTSATGSVSRMVEGMAMVTPGITTT